MKDRFGNFITFCRRGYQEWDSQKECYIKGTELLFPLDDKLGLIKDSRFSPGLGYLCTLFGVNDAYTPSAKLLSECLRITLSSSGVQKNTERIGSQLDSSPRAFVSSESESESCEMMVVSYDATGCPRIGNEPIKSLGRARLSNPTVCKMATVVKVEKYFTPPTSRNSSEPMPKADKSYIGACFGDDNFDQVRDYIHELAWISGQSRAKELVVLGDGQRSNWTTAEEFFPGAVQILDIMHAKGHLAEFCKTLKCMKGDTLPSCYYEWETLMEHGEITELLGELKSRVYFGSHIKPSEGEDALKELEYLETNESRMKYDEYLKKGYPIGSGTIESGCKQVVSNRFKKQGMRWNKDDSQYVLNGRLHYLNGTLKRAFYPRRLNWSLPQVS